MIAELKKHLEELSPKSDSFVGDKTIEKVHSTSKGMNYLATKASVYEAVKMGTDKMVAVSHENARQIMENHNMN